MSTITKLPLGWTCGEVYYRIQEFKRLPKRVLAILSCEWARLALPYYVNEPYYLAMLEAAERALSERSLISAEAANQCRSGCRMYQAPSYYACSLVYYLYHEFYEVYYIYNKAVDIAYTTAEAISGLRDNKLYDNSRHSPSSSIVDDWDTLYNTYLNALGDELEFDSGWRTESTVGIAQAIHNGRAFDRMPLLADALEEAGCDNGQLLKHLRTDNHSWTRADWILWNILQLDV